MAKTRISSRAMNNVVIFAMLFMIVLFNLKKFLPETSAPVSQPLLPADGYLLAIEQDDFRLARAGQSWRQSQLEQAVSVTPTQQLNAWQQGRITSAEEVPGHVANTTPYIVVVWLAGKNDGLVYGFYPDTDDTYVRFDKQWYILKDASLPILLPWNHYTAN